MKAKYLKIDTPCDEQWENMTPTQKGSFCDQCSKEVIDFTHLSPEEIAQKIKETSGSICARITQKQLQTPLLSTSSKKEFQIPYLNLAASVILAGAMTLSLPVQATTSSINTEYVHYTEYQNGTQKTKPKPASLDPNNNEGVKIFKGIITEEVDGKRIENARIMFVTSTQILTTYSKHDGSFSLQVPMRLIDDVNVIQVSYDQVRIMVSEERFFQHFKTKNYVLTKKEMKEPYQILAEKEHLIMGDVGFIVEKLGGPVVLENGRRIPYEDFIKAQMGEKSSCDLTHKEILYFESEAAVAIYGEEAKHGLYILIDEKTF